MYLDTEWFYNTTESIEENTTLSRHKQEKAISILVDNGFIEYKLNGIPAKKHFKILSNNIINFFKTSLRKIDKQVCEKLTNLIDENSQTINNKNKEIKINNNNILLSEIKISDLTEEEKAYHKIAIAFQNVIRKNILDIGGNTNDIDNTKITALNEIRLLITKDGFTKKQIEQVFFFLRDEIPTSEFSWKRNILSIKTLRKNINKILIRSSKTTVNTQPIKTNIPERVVIK